MHKAAVFLMIILFAFTTGCTVRFTADASLLQKYDRPSDNWTVQQTSGPAPTSTTKGETK